MNDLSKKCVNVVLAVEMGRGMGFIGCPIKIVANFNERLLESDSIDPDDYPMFNTELVWETEKRELKKVRSSNTPLRVEVQIANNKLKKDRVGFILLSPRCAGVIPFNSKMEIPFKWHKLLGVAAENKSNHPELYLSLTIRDLTKEDLVEQRTIAVDVDEEEVEIVEEPFIKEGQIIPIQYLPDGFIQIGNELANEIYVLSITIQVAYNLDLLLPEVLVFNQCKEKYYVSFQMFGITIKSKPFCRDLHANIPMNEKIIVRIRTEYTILQDYFNDRCLINVGFYSGQDKLGTTKLSVDTLLKEVLEEEFLCRGCTTNCEQKCFFKFPSPHGIVPTGSNNRQPFIEVVTAIKRTEIRPESAPESIKTIKIPSLECVQTNIVNDSIKVTNTEENKQEEKLKNTIKEEKKESEESEDEEKEEIEDVEEEEEEGEEEEEEEEVEEKPKIVEEERKDEMEKEQYRQLESETFPEVENLSPRSLEGRGDAENEVQDEADKTEENAAVSACGDQTVESKVLELQALQLDLEQEGKESRTKIDSTSQLEQVSTIEEISETSISDITVLRNIPPLPSPDFKIKDEDIQKSINLYQQYCLDVMVESISMKKSIKSKKLYFKFKHPKASSSTMIVSEFDNEDVSAGEDVLLENTRCKMFFISTTEHIRKLVYSWGPKLLLVDENDQILTEELDLYTAMFLSKHRFECSYITEWKSVRTYEPLAKLSISMYLQEYGLDALPKPTNFDLLPPILDEDVAMKELQELQTWKQIQTVQFSADLKLLENQRFKKLCRDWSKRKKNLEDKLTKSILRCQTLSQDLQGAINNIRTKRALELKEAKSTAKAEDDANKNVEKYANTKNDELIEKISKLERENEHLKEIVNDQRHEIQQMRKTALTKEQTTNLLHQLKGLEEKFEDAQKAKSYFKDQWKKAVQEIHDLRSEEHKQLQEKIHNHRIELSQLSLDSFSTTDGKFEFGQNPFHASTTHFEDLKWDNLDLSLGLRAPYSSSSTNI